MPPFDMSSLRQYVEELCSGLSGKAGTTGYYAALQRCFVAFGILSPVCFFIDAPFGRFTSKSNWLSVNGSVGWFVMEIVSPLAFLASLPLGQSPNFPSISSYLSTIVSTFQSLPLARQILVTLFVIHYLNRSTISTLLNPSRARMNISVPISAIVFNIMNGSTMGTYIGGGYPILSKNLNSLQVGLREGMGPRILFSIGISLWLIGFISNIYHDQVLYDLKRDKLVRLESKKGSSLEPTERYSIPPRSKGLYRYVSHPSYSSEWLEWFGYLLCTLSLSTPPFPPPCRSGGSESSPLVPFVEWYLEPPALFLWQEIGVMLPRARSGHRWYEKTFGEKEWKAKGQKWVVIPGVY